MTSLRLTPESCTLLVVDVQEKLMAAIPDALARRAVQHTGWLLEAARRLGIPVAVTEQYPKGLGHTVEPLRQTLDAFSEAPTIIEKVEFDACAASGFSGVLDGLADRTVVVAGVEAHICVYQTVRGLVERGVGVHVPFDATASRSSENLRVAQGLWERAGAVVTCTEAVLFDWLGKSGGETFKAVSRLLKEAASAD